MKTEPSGDMKYCLLLSLQLVPVFFPEDTVDVMLKHFFDLSSNVQVGWNYGSISADILTSFKMHCRGWRSVYCMPKRPAFRGTAPINLSDRLNQVLRWAVGSLEILFSRHCPILYGLNEGKLKGLQRVAYISNTVYTFSSIPLLIYCLLPAVCLLTDKFITPSVTIIFLFLNKKTEKRKKG